MNDLLRKNNDQPTNNIDVSCIQTVSLKHAKGLFVLLETNFFTFEAKAWIMCSLLLKKDIGSYLKTYFCDVKFSLFCHIFL